LRKVLPAATIINQSISGNTIGFDNLGKESLNTLKNIDQYIKSANDSLNGKTFDYVIVCLGTNDCKADYANRQDQVPENLNTLISKIENHLEFKAKRPQFVLVSPPPYGDDQLLLDKYKGGDKRVSALIEPFSKIANKHYWKFINIYKMLRPDFNKLSPDGVHMKAEGQMRIAKMIVANF
jgi:lysophospholipase L1-like esterase